MLAPSGELLRAGMALKLNHVKRAAQSYLRDQTSQATGKVTSYAVAGGLFAVAGLFVVAAFFVGLIALYRWVGITYGQFWGFGAVAAVLLVLAAVCAGVAMAQMKRKAKPVVPLASRLRVAIATPRIPRGTVKEAVKEVATTIPLAPLAPGERGGIKTWPARANRPVQLGLMLAAVGLVGLTAARRRRNRHSLEA
ncbi:phage holin family protein [Bradyrhizobium sp. IC3069]|uniref:Phage holin family protein n=1 Tax=Bradyrhizobium yuanmingense TaxID=108015 RepID=A0ABV4GEA3_9BRAD|nr:MULTISPECIES: phage holin family protein [Bradyrhizobium]MCA1363303.1 phage holin family protein [Bradyrhizobium sp. IC4059]MCA1377728.1 phage holin family protein [Bradyrhizobium sp. IC4060]MCA1416205.1 phage holin family protein [Bradyrhizobium sp. NBAIM20]MCA1427543.1 phage holin family protein [Bradyrhizobium sp. NBAIM16]MCA1465936.1 phage holin family protein [Bradyrhizobium sp. NBAIM18]